MRNVWPTFWSSNGFFRRVRWSCSSTSARSWRGSIRTFSTFRELVEVLDVLFQRHHRLQPADLDHTVISPPPGRVLETALADAQPAGRSVHRALDLKRHRADWAAVGR